MMRLQPDLFLNELSSMFERTIEKGSVWVTLKHSSDKSKAKMNKMVSAGEEIEYRCLIRANDGKKTISTMVGAKDHQRFQASYATILKARMTSLKKREKKDKKRAAEAERKLEISKKRPVTKKGKGGRSFCQTRRSLAHCNQSPAKGISRYEVSALASHRMFGSMGPGDHSLEQFIFLGMNSCGQIHSCGQIP